MRKTIFAHGEVYHIYNRGVERRTTFTSPSEYKRFLAYLYILNTEESIRPAELIEKHGDLLFTLPRENPLVALGAYCLMPNHFHLLATPTVEGGISKFMHRVQTAYTMYFNTKHKRTGGLFQGTFKAEHADYDAYAKYLYSYIHLNPAKLADPLWKEFGAKDFNKVRAFVRNYPYSSFGEYKSGEPVITDPSKFPDYVSNKKDLEEHIDFWLNFRQNNLP
ncbi:MAG: transposase [bacterium]|nr:transposase [bacterium]